MTFRKATATALLALLTQLGVQPNPEAVAQVTGHPNVLSPKETPLPQIGIGKYSAEMFIHVPGLGDGTGEMIVSDNKMRYHASFRAGFIWETDWIDFATGLSIQKQHTVVDHAPVVHETFIANLKNIPVTRKPDDSIKGYPVQVYHVDHQKVTQERAFDGDIYMYQGVPLLIAGKELNFTRPKCDGTWEDMRIEVIALHMGEEQNQEALKPTTEKLKEARPNNPIKVCAFP